MDVVFASLKISFYVQIIVQNHDVARESYGPVFSVSNVNYSIEGIYYITADA